MGFLDQTGDVSQRRVGSGFGRLNLERRFAIDATGIDFIAIVFTDRNAFAGNRRLVDRTRAVDDDAIQGKFFARRDDKTGARLDFRRLDNGFPAIGILDPSR